MLKLVHEEMNVPTVIIEIWTGRTDEEKETLMKGVMNAFETIGIKKERVTVIIHEAPKSNWGMRGEQASKVTS